MRVQLGAENDTALHARVRRVLAEHGARCLWRWRGHAGSQELERDFYFVRGRLVRIASETYQGLWMAGETSVVGDLARAVSDTGNTDDVA